MTCTCIYVMMSCVLIGEITLMEATNNAHKIFWDQHREHGGWSFKVARWDVFLSFLHGFFNPQPPCVVCTVWIEKMTLQNQSGVNPDYFITASCWEPGCSFLEENIGIGVGVLKLVWKMLSRHNRCWHCTLKWFYFKVVRNKQEAYGPWRFADMMAYH